MDEQMSASQVRVEVAKAVWDISNKYRGDDPLRFISIEEVAKHANVSVARAQKASIFLAEERAVWIDNGAPVKAPLFGIFEKDAEGLPLSVTPMSIWLSATAMHYFEEFKAPTDYKVNRLTLDWINNPS